VLCCIAREVIFDRGTAACDFSPVLGENRFGSKINTFAETLKAIFDPGRVIPTDMQGAVHVS